MGVKNPVGGYRRRWGNPEGYKGPYGPSHAVRPGGRLTAISLAWLGALALAASPPDPAVGALVDKVIEAYGGLPALEKFPVMIQEGHVAAHEAKDVGRIVRIQERPRRLRVSIAYPGSAPEQRILDGARGWRDGREVSGSPPHGAMLLQAARMDLPVSLSTGRQRLVDEGTVERDGVKLRAILLPLGDGLSITAEIDPASGRIVRSVGRMPGPVGSLEFVTAYSEFRKVSGVLVPFREENFVQGRHSGTTEILTTEFLVEAPTGAFRP